MEAQQTFFIGGPFDGGSTEEVATKVLVPSRSDDRWMHGYKMEETNFGTRYVYDGVYYSKTKKKWKPPEDKK